MDKELLDILKEIQSDMKTMQSDMKTMQGDIKTMQDDMKSVKGELKGINVRLDNVEGKTDKNSLMLENLNKKIEVVAEVQTSFKEQLDRTTDKNGKTLSDRLNVIEMSVTDTSSRVKDVQNELARVVRVTAENWTDIAQLKLIK